ncbi:MAG: 5-oxoprolinase/urea amidolyase family protein [Streptosporangiales bacterium]|nr:5-oxoprolinase/urea amidolyase family protein [Streptosporangiales bacterium]
MTIEVLQPGIQTTVQDYPGRVGLMSRGFFPAGAMDHLALRLGNALVGNEPGDAALEVALGKAKLRFDRAAVVALTGATVEATVDGEPVPSWQAVEVPAGGELRLGIAKGPGFRVYIAVAGGIDVPEVFGARATYTMGALGGVEGRALRKGDVLPVGEPRRASRGSLDQSRLPAYVNEWDLEVVPGPHASEEFLAEEDVALLFTRQWTVDRNSNRTGIRLDAQRLTWARSNGGIAGGHPSNILDNGYPVGGINLNGDTPVILGPDGPTSGGFVVVAVVAHASMWKLGQMRPGADKITLRPVSVEQAQALADEQNALVEEVRAA